MIKKIYQVFHIYDVDGGFGDPVQLTSIVGTYERYQDAKAFVDRFSKPHIYSKPYGELTCGKLEVMECDLIPAGAEDLDEIDSHQFWWLNNIRDL